jgi:RNA polymerase sigma-70 factor, ECF subfamily
MAVLSGMFHDHEDVLDTYQETFIAAFRGLPRFQFECSFTTWIYRIAVNTGLSYKRKRSRRERIMENVPPEDLQPSPFEAPDRGAQNAELRFRIRQAMKKLSARERMAFVLCHQQGLRIGEASDLMTCSTGSIKSYLFRAREKMKQDLADLKT